MRPTEDADLALLLRHVLDAAIKLQDADFGDVQLLDSQTGTLRIVAHRGVGEEFLKHFACVDVKDTSACGTALKQGQRVIIEDVTKYAPYSPHLAVAAKTGYRGVNCTPLMERATGRPLGMLTTLFREPYKPDETRLQLADIFAEQAADLVSCHGAQQRLRENEEFFRHALEGGRMGSWEWDSETHLIKADAAHQAFFGMPPQKRPLPNEAYWKLMDREEQEIGTQRAQHALDNGNDIELELRVYPPDGGLRWIAVRGRARNGGSESLIGISYDITERKNQERALQEYQERLNAAVELAGLGLYSVEINGGAALLTWDNRVRSLWGLPPDCEVTYDMWESAVHADDRERVRAAVAGAYDPSGDGVYDAEYRVVGADGVERWVATRAQVRFEQGRPVSLLGVVRDITDRKMIEHGLELVVDVRTSELIDAAATLQAEREARQRTDERLELLQGELSRGLFAAIESRKVGLARPAERRVREAAHKIAELSRRERQVLDGLVQGEPHKTIAHRLGISVRTVEIHRTRMLHRLGTPHLAEAIRLAVLAELAGE